MRETPTTDNFAAWRTKNGPETVGCVTLSGLIVAARVTFSSEEYLTVTGVSLEVGQKRNPMHGDAVCCKRQERHGA